jgi:hypothetical protein
MNRAKEPFDLQHHVLGKLFPSAQAAGKPRRLAMTNGKGRRRKLTRAGALRVFRHWRDACARAQSKRTEPFDVHLVWFGLQLTEMLSKRDRHAPSEEWAAPAVNALALLGQCMMFLDVSRDAKPGMSAKERSRLDTLADSLDEAAATIFQEIRSVMHARRFRTRNIDLMLDILHFEIGDGAAATVLLRHMQKTSPHIDRTSDGAVEDENTISSFAWDTYNRVALLDRLADEYPDHLMPAARQMHAWPVLRHRHTAGDARFAEVAERLEVGRNYPLDTRRTARFRPDSPMVRYLDALAPRLSLVRSCCVRHNTTKDRDIVHWWEMDQTRQAADEKLTPQAIEVLRGLRDLPPLTKPKATEWSKKVIVPFIMETDARGAGPYDEPALEQIRRQRDIKSRAVFESRLESKVAKTLRSLARPE